MIKAECPECGAELELHIDLSEGPPDEIGTECDCGCIPVWKLDWWYEFALGEFAHYERRWGKDVIQLSQEEFDALLEYSMSIPTGTIIGKRWKRRTKEGAWLMGEYIPDKPGYVGIKWRVIEIRSGEASDKTVTG